MQELFQFLNYIHPLKPEAEQHIGRILRKKILRKKQVWLQEDTVCDKIAFIEKGLLKVYFESGSKEVCLWYNKENDVIISAHSFLTQNPSSLAIRAVTPVTLWYIHYDELQMLYDRYVDFNVNGRKVLEHYYGLLELHISLVLQPMKVRYQLLSKLYPWMLSDKRFNDSMLAAYLGMTRASFYACKKDAA